MKGNRLALIISFWLAAGSAFIGNMLPQPPLFAADAPSLMVNTQTANFAVIFPTQHIQPGSQIEGLIRFYLDPGWHLYWKNPGDSGLAPTFDWQLPDGITVKEIKWPVPSRFERGGALFYGYEKTPEWIVTFYTDKNLKEGIYPITLTAFWLACDGSCVPSSQQFEFSFTISSTAPPIPAFPALDEAKKQLPVQLEGGKAMIDNDRLIIDITIPEEKTAQLKSMILYPESGGIFALDQFPVWNQEGEAVELSLFCLPSAKDILIKAKKFAGLLQLVSSQNKPLITYALNVPYEATAAHAFARPIPTFSQEQPQWKAIDLSKEENVFQVENTMKVVLLLAFLGGIILNFTPCVLPIVGLKLLNLISFRALKGFRAIIHGLLFTLGILTMFWILAGGLYLLEYLGMTIGWGFQLQEPHFVIALTILLFCFAMNLFGVFEIGTSISALAAEVETGVTPTESKNALSHFGSFASGALATLIATPCTGPLLGSVLGFASMFHPVDGLILFSAIGLGMAFPLLIITAFPPLIRLLPKPGPWMVTLKQFFGFCLLATITWLLWVLHAEAPCVTLSIVASGFTLLAFGLWIYGRWGTPVRSLICRFFGKFFALLFILISIFSLIVSVDNRIMLWMMEIVPAPETIQWERFSQGRLEKELDKGHTVFVEFSAKWCLTCQTNKLAFLHPSVVQAFRAHHIVALEADWTTGDPAITKMLRSLGRNGVPVYAIFRRGQEPILLPEIVTPEMIVRAVSTSE
jgi:thiol:disulfide interchange protein/DsbC/DsbD-like thiol-disulfide interchange protein